MIVLRISQNSNIQAHTCVQTPGHTLPSADDDDDDTVSIASTESLASTLNWDALTDGIAHMAQCLGLLPIKKIKNNKNKKKYSTERTPHDKTYSLNQH